VALEPLRKSGLGGAGADLHVGGFAVLEQNHGRDRADAIFHGGRGILVDVELDDLHLALQFTRELFEYRRNGAARATPLGPEIDEHGLFRGQYFLAKIGVGNLSCHWICLLG
jgi:hypothetical protein